MRIAERLRAAGGTTLAAVAACALTVALAQEGIDAKPAVAAAENWLAALDSGRYGQSWEDAAPMFRETMPRVKWETTVEGARAPLGVVIARKLRQANYTRGIPSDPQADIYVLQYDTRFENRPLSTEIVTPIKGADGTWRVSAYVLR